MKWSYLKVLVFLVFFAGICLQSTDSWSDNDAASSTSTTTLEQRERNIRAELFHVSAKHGKEHEKSLSLTLQLANVLRLQERFPESEYLYERLMEQYRRILDDTHPKRLEVTIYLGEVLEHQGLYEEAEPLFQTVYTHSVKRFGPLHPKTLYAIQDLALHYEDQGRFEEAQTLYNNTLMALQKEKGAEHADTLNFQVYLADLFLLTKAFHQAEQLYKHVLSVWEKQFKTHHPKRVKLRHKLAKAHLHQGGLQEAETHIEQALVSRRSTLGEDHPETLRSQHHLGDLYHRQGRHQEAKKILGATLATTTQLLGDHHPHSLETIHTLAAVHEVQEDLQEALRLRHKGYEHRTRFLSRILRTVGSNQRAGLLQLHRPELDTYLHLLTRLPKQQQGRLALEVSLQRKGLLLKIASEIQHVAALAKTPRIKQLNSQLTQARKRLASLTLLEPRGTNHENYLSKLVVLEKEVEGLEARLGKESVRLQKLLNDVTIGHLLEVVPSQSVLVDFMLFRVGGQQRLLAGVLRKEQGGLFFDLLTYDNFAAIQAGINDYRQIIQDEDADDEEVKGVGRALHALLWQPLETVLGSLKNLYIVPDGSLNLLPFNALVDADNRYLLETLDLHFLTSSRELLHPKPAMTDHTIMVVASPDYSADGLTDPLVIKQINKPHHGHFDANLRSISPSGLHGLEFDDLSGAGKEGKMILDIVSAVSGASGRVYQRYHAQERLFWLSEEFPAILHIATHGFFMKPDPQHHKRLLKRQQGGAGHLPPSGDNPLLRAGLAFAGINQTAPYLGKLDTDNDGILTAYEVLSLDLSATRVAVLSACETGLGDVHEGEGVYGLRRAFMEAGVGAVISSLWEVSDAGTQTLMISFYRYLIAGQLPTIALRAAQRAMLQSEEWNYPYVWAAFFLVGR